MARSEMTTPSFRVPQYWSVRWNNEDVAMHNLLCLVDYYHLIGQAAIPLNNWQRIASKNAVEIDSLQAYFSFSCEVYKNCQRRTHKISEGRQSFVTLVWRHKSTLGEVPKAWPS